MPTSPADPSDNDEHHDLLVLGAGPAGLAAAGAAARRGLSVALVDAGPRVGGQYWRHRPDDDGRHHHGWRAFLALRAGVSAVRHLPGHAVWHVERHDDGVTAHCTVVGSDGDRLRRVHARAAVVATGAHDRQLPFPGWTLPGVSTAGGVQSLLKGDDVLAGRRVAVAGTGPFLLAVAAGLARAGATVVEVLEAGDPAWIVRESRGLVSRPGKLVEGAGYAATLARHRIPVRTRSAVVAAHPGPDGELGAVTVARLDRDWHPRPGSERRLAVDTLAVGWGFTPQLDLAVQLGVDTHLDVDGSLVADVDPEQRSSVPGVWIAGEACGVGGAPLAVVEGEIAGRHAAATLTGRAPGRMASLRRRRSGHRAFAAALHRAFPVRPGWAGWVEPDTTVCRCEEVDVAAVRAAVDELGAADPRAVKLYARPGMGPCQGRVCGFATACLVAGMRPSGLTAADLRPIAHRPIAAPLTLGALAATDQQ